mmetsp:Transcript_37340/g.110259  ORF Transcript_37340/g.110259 Transcript_37340/m.110259 type:complete len:246 (-) Transcript_37340:264-1001(-)
MALELCNETHFAGSPHTIHSCRHVPGRALQQMPCLGRALQQTPCLSWGSRRTHLGTWSLSANASGTASASMRTPRGKRRPWVHHRWRAAGTRLLPELSRCPMPGSLSRHVAHLCPAAAVSRNVIRDSLLSVTKLQQLCLRRGRPENTRGGGSSGAELTGSLYSLVAHWPRSCGGRLAAVKCGRTTVQVWNRGSCATGWQRGGGMHSQKRETFFGKRRGHVRLAFATAAARPDHNPWRALPTCLRG